MPSTVRYTFDRQAKKVMALRVCSKSTLYIPSLMKTSKYVYIFLHALCYNHDVTLNRLNLSPGMQEYSRNEERKKLLKSRRKVPNCNAPQMNANGDQFDDGELHDNGTMKKRRRPNENINVDSEQDVPSEQYEFQTQNGTRTRVNPGTGSGVSEHGRQRNRNNFRSNGTPTRHSGRSNIGVPPNNGPYLHF